jgi:hypothetical protein
MTVNYISYPSALKMEAVEVPVYKFTRRHSPEDNILLLREREDNAWRGDKHEL